MSKKTFFISLSVVLGILFLGTTPSKVKEQPKWEKPESGKWCLGYDYKNHRYRYDTSPKTKFQPTKTVIKKLIIVSNYMRMGTLLRNKQKILNITFNPRKVPMITTQKISKN